MNGPGNFYVLVLRFGLRNILLPIWTKKEKDKVEYKEKDKTKTIFILVFILVGENIWRQIRYKTLLGWV